MKNLVTIKRTITSKKKYTYEEWRAEGKRRFGDDEMKWKFKCPICGFVASTQDYKNAKAPVGAVAFSCIGRWIGAKRINVFGLAGKTNNEKPCNYAGGGLICINPIEVVKGKEIHHMFEFADEEKETP